MTSFQIRGHELDIFTPSEYLAGDGDAQGEESDKSDDEQREEIGLVRTRTRKSRLSRADKIKRVRVNEEKRI